MTNKLTNLEGSPKIIKGIFDCSYNNLVSLKGAPKEMTGDFICRHNQELNNLLYLPQGIDNLLLTHCNLNEISLHEISFSKYLYHNGNSKKGNKKISFLENYYEINNDESHDFNLKIDATQFNIIKEKLLLEDNFNSNNNLKKSKNIKV